MARLLVLVTAALTLLAAPAGATVIVPAPVAAPVCHRSPAPPRVVATRTSTRSGTAAIVACDRARGRRVVLRRGFVGDDAPRTHVPLLSRPAVRGTRIVWSEMSGVPPWHVRQDLRSADVRRPGRQAHRRIGPVPHTGAVLLSSESMQVLALAGGGLAYISYGHLIGAGPSTLVLERPGRPRRVLTRRLFGLAHVEDGHTLVWPSDGYRALDLTPIPRDARGCPMRSRYTTRVLETSQVRVTAADEGPGESSERVRTYRVCWKATGQDAIAFTSDEDVLLDDLVAADGPFVALPVRSDGRYACAATVVVLIDARTGPPALVPTLNDPGGVAGGPCAEVQAVVVDETGAPAWIRDTGSGALRLETRPADARAPAVVLDSGPARNIADLAARPGGGFTWTHDGAPRSWSPTP